MELPQAACLALLFLLALPRAGRTLSMGTQAADEYTGSPTQIIYSAIVNLTYRDPLTGEARSEQEDMGLYASESRLDDEAGWVVHVRGADGTNDGCAPPVNAPPAGLGGESWIALIERGACRFQQKIVNVAVNLNASAVVIYNTEYNQLLSMKHKVDDVVSVFIRRQSGERIAALVDNGTRVWMHVSCGTSHISPGGGGGGNAVNRSSVLFVSVSFIVLMVISLAWLVFYYVQRVRYAHTKDRLAKRLMSAAKKALGRMGQRTLRKGDREVDVEFELCAVCVEMYRASETVRVLPCKHMFHKACVDPWLVEHRTCPICKLDILRAYGIHVMGSRELTTLTNLDSSLLLSGGGASDPHHATPEPRPDPPSAGGARGRGGGGEPDRQLLLGVTMRPCDPPTARGGEGERGGVVKEVAEVHCSLGGGSSAGGSGAASPCSSSAAWEEADDDYFEDGGEGDVVLTRQER